MQTRHRAVIAIKLTVQGDDYGHEDAREAVEEFLDDIHCIHMHDVDIDRATIDLIEPDESTK